MQAIKTPKDRIKEYKTAERFPYNIVTRITQKAEGITIQIEYGEPKKETFEQKAVTENTRAKKNP